MAYYDEPLTDPSLDFDAREAALLQQQARIKALRGIAAAPIASAGEAGGWTSAVTGTRIAPSVLKTPTAALLSPLIGQVGADLQEGRLNQARTSLNRDQQDDYQDILRSMPQAHKVALGPDEPVGSFVGDPSMAIAQMTDPVERERAMTAWRNQQAGNMRTVEPTQAEMLGVAGRAQRNPLARALAAKLVENEVFTRPAKTEERSFTAGEKALDRGATLSAAVAKARQDALDKEAQRRQSQINAEIVAGARRETASTGTFTLSPDGSTLYNTKDPNQRMPSGLEPKPVPVKPLPVEAGKAWRENNKSIDTIDKALGQLSANPDAIGLTKGAVAGIPGVGQNLINWWNPGGVEARALVSNIGSMVIHDRSGATVTAAETPRLRPFIPSATDSAVDAAKKLKLFKAEYQKMQLEIKDYAASQGYKDPGEAVGGAAPAPAAPQSNLPRPPKAGDVVDGYRFKGGNPNTNSNWEPAQ